MADNTMDDGASERENGSEHQDSYSNMEYLNPVVGLEVFRRPDSSSSVCEKSEPPEHSPLLSLPPELVMRILRQVSSLEPRELADSSLSSLCRTCRTLAGIGTPMLYSHFENDSSPRGIRKVVLFWTTLFARECISSDVPGSQHLPKPSPHLKTYVKSVSISLPDEVPGEEAYGFFEIGDNLSVAFGRLAVLTFQRRTSPGNPASVDSWKRNLDGDRRFGFTYEILCPPFTVAAMDLLTECPNVESVEYRSDKASANALAVFTRWRFPAAISLPKLRSLSIAQETDPSSRGTIAVTESWWVEFVTQIVAKARNVSVGISALTAASWSSSDPRDALPLRDRPGLGNLTNLNLHLSIVSPDALGRILGSCGPLATFVWSPSDKLTANRAEELYCPSKLIIDLLRRHKDTLKRLTLGLSRLQFAWGIDRQPMGSLKDFTALGNLILDDGCYGHDEYPVYILPPQLEVFTLFGWYKTRETDLIHLARYCKAPGKSGNRGLRDVALVPWPGGDPSAEEAADMKIVADWLGHRGVSFAIERPNRTSTSTDFGPPVSERTQEGRDRLNERRRAMVVEGPKPERARQLRAFWKKFQHDINGDDDDERRQQQEQTTNKENNDDDDDADNNNGDQQQQQQQQ